jgi:ribose-phosphate pyrophosphokinase
VINGKKSNWGIVSPDLGDVRRMKALASKLGIQNMITLLKDRDVATGKTTITGMQGSVKGLNLIFVDDMIAGGGTMIRDGGNYVWQHGAKRIIGIATHAFFYGDCLELLTRSHFEKLFVTNSIAHHPEKEKLIADHPKISIVNIAPLLAEAIYRNSTGGSIKELL